MFTALANYISRSRIKRSNAVRKSDFINWQKIQKIALILDEQQVNKSEIDKFIEGTGKYVEVFYIEPRSKQPSYADWKCYFKKEKNLLSLPKTEALKSLASKNFDVSICVSGSNQLFSANLSSSIPSRLHCGNINLFGELDLIVQKKDSQSLIPYLKEVQKYLEMIKTGR